MTKNLSVLLRFKLLIIMTLKLYIYFFFWGGGRADILDSKNLAPKFRIDLTHKCEQSIYHPNDGIHQGTKWL